MSIWYDVTTHIYYRTLDFMGFPGYRVGNDGSVWSAMERCKRGKGNGRGLNWRIGNTWHLLKTDSSGVYQKAFFCRDKKAHGYLVHQLILTAFIGPCPTKMEACHENGNPADNRLETSDGIPENPTWKIESDTAEQQEANPTGPEQILKMSIEEKRPVCPY